MTRRLCSICLVAIGFGLACLAVLSGQTRPSGHEPVKACPADKPLGGHIEIDSEWINPVKCRGTRHVVLRFTLVPAIPQVIGNNKVPWTSQLVTGFSATEITYELSTPGCSGRRNSDQTCSAPSGRQTGTIKLGSVGTLGFQAFPGASYVRFDPLHPKIEVMLDSRNFAANSLQTTYRCVSPNGGGGSGSWLFSFGGLFITPAGSDCSSTEGNNDEADYRVCAQPTECSYPANEAIKQDCIIHADRHALLPFTGEASWNSPKASQLNYFGILNYKINWQVGCGCENGPCGERSSGPTPIPTATPDPCGSTAQQDALWQQCINQENAIAGELSKLIQTQQEETKEANSHFNDFKSVADTCKGWDKLKQALELLIGGEAFSADLAPEALAEFKEFQETITLLTEMAGKAADGENPWTAMAPEEAKKVIEEGEKLNQFITKLDILLAGYTPESGRKFSKSVARPFQKTFLKARSNTWNISKRHSNR